MLTKTFHFLTHILISHQAHIPGHLLYALRSVVLIMDVAGDVFEVVHVRADQYVPQLHKVTVRLVLH